MTNLLARAISIILNPLLVFLIVPYLLLFRMSQDSVFALRWTAYTIIFILAIGIFIAYCVKKRIFIDLDVSKREQRPLLFIISFILLLLYILGVYVLHGPTILIILALGVIIGIGIVSIINTKLKASIHVATVSAFIVAAAIDLKGFYFALLLLIPVVGWARVKEKKHTVPETIAGGILGSLLSLGLYATLGLGIHL